jgi:8-oxo-dGTP pyrophosphatase MutT (NUDIX family)
MGERPLAIAVSALVRDNRILLIRRIKGSYAGLMGLPGGKIEQDEHASEAAVREALEESGIESTVRRFMGIVSEHEVEDGRVANHYLLFIFELEPKHAEITESSEGKLEWCDLKEIGKMRDRIIPSDFEIIGRLGGNGAGYYNCVIEKAGETYLLREFKQIG